MLTRPEQPTEPPRCSSVLSIGSHADRCELPAEHKGIHLAANNAWTRYDL